MEYQFALALAFYICGCFYMVFGAVIINANTSSKINRMFLFLASLLSIWSFSYSISNSVPTAEVSAFWRTFSAFGWGVFSSCLLHFVLVLTNTKCRFGRRAMLVLLYLPSAVNVILFGPFGLLVDKHYIMVPSDFGWINMAPLHAGAVFLNLYYVVYSLVTLVILFSWWAKFKPRSPEKKAASLFLISIVSLYAIEFFADMLPEVIGMSTFPKIVVITLLFPTIMLVFVLNKFGLLVEGERRAYSILEIRDELTGDRKRLFQTATIIFFIGSATSFLVGYFGMGRDLNSELAIAGTILFLGIFLRFVPNITKNHRVQNTIFLITCSVAMLYFMTRDIDTGGVTIWAIYVLFLLFMVILDSRAHSKVFIVIATATQIIFWLKRPSISVTIDIHEYVTRIFIIWISYFVVRYLTAEYASRVKEYKTFAKEQEILERISSSFITIDRKNISEKIDEMFEMALGTLDFDHAYIVVFDADYTEATIYNTCVNYIAGDSFPYKPGMKLDESDLSALRPMISRDSPTICEDIAGYIVEGSEDQSSFFLSRGIMSFFVMPIKSDDMMNGMLVVEYRDRMDEGLAERRLYFLRIIANVLGDAKKKIIYEERLYNFAYFDESTKLPNRNMLKSYLDETISGRTSSEKAAVLDIELENLKIIYDNFGHDIGERIVVKLAEILGDMLQETCYIARPSEDRFVVVMSDVQNRKQVEDYARDLLSSFSRPISTETEVEELFVVVSIGIAMYPDDGRDADILLKNANLAGYELKNSSEELLFYTERLGHNIEENTLFTNRLFKALENEEFFLEYQPQLSCEVRKTVGVEALLRWNFNGSERISPGRFIPILEQTGLIYEVGVWVLEQSLRDHKRLLEKGFGPLRFAINVSLVQLTKGEFVPDFERIIRESGVDPKYIEFEITESTFSENILDTIAKLYRIREFGSSIAIDDFGSGYSSLNRLSKIPFDRIKIDKELVNYIGLEKTRSSIAEITILLAKTFDAGITAEGVETRQQVEFLRKAACDEIQGNFFSKPLSVDELEEFLEKEVPGYGFDN